MKMEIYRLSSYFKYNTTGYVMAMQLADLAGVAGLPAVSKMGIFSSHLVLGQKKTYREFTRFY